MNQLHHELTHLWNVSSWDTYSPRWNEGLASFLEFLTVEALEQHPALDRTTGWFSERIRSDLEEDSIFAGTPMTDFGRRGIAGYSYSLGAIMFQVLYHIVGQEDFNHIVGSFYQQCHATGATTDEFARHTEKSSTADLARFFNDWIYTTAYQELLEGNLLIEEIAERY